MNEGYSGTPLLKKLGIKNAHRVLVAGEPSSYWAALGKLPQGCEVCGSRAGNLDFVHFFSASRSTLRRRMPGLRKKIKPDGMIWVSWPKKSSGVASTVSEDVVREVAFENQLVDVKVCTVDETWSGLKLVIRLEDR